MKLTDAVVRRLLPAAKDQFVRCEYTRGFGVKVSPAGRKSFFAEGRIKGAGTARKSIGTYPVFSVEEARKLAIDLLRQMQSGINPGKEQKRKKAQDDFKGTTLGQVFEEYVKVRDLSDKTVYDYGRVMQTVFEDWYSQPISDISRHGILKRHTETKDTRGHSMASKSFRILSAVCNYAKADEMNGVRLLTDNPVDVLKDKRVPKFSKKRETHLTGEDISRLMHFYATEKDWDRSNGGHPTHGVTDQGMNLILLLLYSGLRRKEGCNLLWEDIDLEQRLLLARDTKNKRTHSIPLSEMLVIILKEQKALTGDTPWVFVKKDRSGPLAEPTSQLRAICKATKLSFTLHDLRRTFATHAYQANVDYETIRRALNHKSGGSITSDYIISSVENLRPAFDKIWEQFWEYYDPGLFDRFNNPKDHEPIDDHPPENLEPFFRDMTVVE